MTGRRSWWWGFSLLLALVLSGATVGWAAPVAAMPGAANLLADDPAELTDHGLQALLRGDLAPALADFDRALAVDPSFLPARLNRAGALLRARRYAEAVADYSVIIQARPDDFLAYGNRGVARVFLMENALAVADLTRALEVNPSYREARYTRAVALRNLGRNEEAIADLNRFLADQPRRAEAYRERGQALLATGRPTEALTDFAKAAELAPDSVDLELLRGQALEQLGRAAQGTSGVARQEIEVTLVPEKHLLQGTSTLVLTPPVPRRLELRLAAGATDLQALANGQEVPCRLAGGLLTVDLPPVAGHLTLVVRYRVVFNDPVPTQVVSTEDPTYGVAAAITSQGTFLGEGVGWFPEPSSLPRQRRIVVHAPAGTEAVTNGQREESRTDGRTTTSAWTEGRPVGGLALAAGPYRVASRPLGPVTLFTFLSPANVGLAERYLAKSAEYLELYQGLFGPYPFEKFAVVENFLPTGYGFPSYTLLGGSVIRLPFILDTSLPHEIAHTWWGNGVLVADQGGNWSEGLATYTADYLLEERKSPRAGAEYRRKILADYAALVLPEKDFPLREFSRRADPASRAIGYGKGAMVFHLVRREIGDPAFFAALRSVARERLYQETSWSDFGQAFSRAGSRDLAPLLEPWLTRPGGPQLALEGVQLQQDGAGWKVSGEVVQTGIPYQLSLPLRLETVDRAVERDVTLEGRRTSFSLAVPARPRRLLLDPDAQVFRLLAPGEIPPTVNRLKGSRALLAVRTADCRADDAGLRLLLASLGQAEAPLMSEGEAAPERLAGKDLLICGLPARAELLPSLPEGVTAGGDGFAVEGKQFAGVGDSLFLVVNRPAVSGRVVALFRPGSVAAALASARKVTHYGKYGYLAFTDGENRTKGTFPVETPESSVVFPGEEGR